MARAGTVHSNHDYGYLPSDHNLLSIKNRSNSPRYPGSTTYRPLHDRLKLYSLVSDLRTHGHSYRQIIEKVFATTSIRLSKASISDWTRGTHHPLGSVNAFNPEPCQELAYVIGVVLSDGNLNVHGYHREMLLSVTDQDFAQEFSRCVARILGRARHYAVRWSEKRRRWIVQGRGILLYNFLNRPWQQLKPQIEHDEKCMASFLRAFFDAEGSITGRRLCVYNTDLQLLFYVKNLLAALGIATSKPFIVTPAGKIMRDPRTGIIYRSQKNCYQMSVRSNHLAHFNRQVRFTIGRKQERLDLAA